MTVAARYGMGRWDPLKAVTHGAGNELTTPVLLGSLLPQLFNEYRYHKFPTISVYCCCMSGAQSTHLPVLTLSLSVSCGPSAAAPTRRRAAGGLLRAARGRQRDAGGDVEAARAGAAVGRAGQRADCAARVAGEAHGPGGSWQRQAVNSRGCWMAPTPHGANSE